MRLRTRCKSKANEQQLTSSSQPQLQHRKQNLELPAIKKPKYQISDTYSISQNYIKINRQSHGFSEPSSARSSSDKTCIQYRYDKILNLQNLPIQDRIHQKVQQNQQRYQRIVNYVRWKSKDNRMRRNKDALKFMYERIEGRGTGRIQPS